MCTAGLDVELQFVSGCGCENYVVASGVVLSGVVLSVCLEYLHPTLFSFSWLEAGPLGPRNRRGCVGRDQVLL